MNEVYMCECMYVCVCAQSHTHRTENIQRVLLRNSFSLLPLYSPVVVEGEMDGCGRITGRCGRRNWAGEKWTAEKNWGRLGSKNEKKGATVLSWPRQAAVEKEEEEKVTGLNDMTSCHILLLTSSKRPPSDRANAPLGYSHAHRHVRRILQRTEGRGGTTGEDLAFF